MTKVRHKSKLYIPNTLNIDLILWHTQLIVCAENVKSWVKIWVISFTFQAYTLPNTWNCMCVGLCKFHIWILKHFFHCPKRPALPRHKSISFIWIVWSTLYVYLWLYLLFNFFFFHGYFTFEITQPMKTAALWRRRDAQS